MKKGLIALAVIIVLGLIVGSMYNGLVSLDEDVNSKWANVESSYQRRADLIPNIVNTAQSYAKFEKETFVEVTEARSKASSIVIDPSNITPEQLQQFQKAQSNLTGSLSRLLATFERYPDLKANENFRELINELERTENRIDVDRKRFNESAQGLNTEIRSFPKNLVAGIFGFDKRAYFEAEEGSDKAPVVPNSF